MMEYIEIIGFVAAILTTGAFLPQVYKTGKTKDVSGLSLPMLLMTSFGVFLWFGYALLIKSPSMIGANGVTLISVIVLLFFKVKYSKKI